MSEQQYEGIAIIGMAGRFPGAESVEEFWSNLVAGKDGISFFSDADLAAAGLDPAALRARGHYVPARGIVKDVDCFDAAFFGVHPREAEVMDPQHRIFLETCWTSLERAGYAPNEIQCSVGVFGGVSPNTFYRNVLVQRPDLIDLIGQDLVRFGNEKDYVATRVAYKLGLHGPAVTVSTACSTSLVAVCQAYQSLLNYECDVALAGGACIRVPQHEGYFHDAGNIGSADGHTRTFDAQANGTAGSNGVGVVVLKRLEDAVKDGDLIYAVIKGAALNNDGSQRVSFSAPGVSGQSDVIAMAHAIAGINPETISYVEAHGTATPLGDPIEIAGLTKAFRLGTDAKQFCAIGSVKSNIGHLDVAAGVAGLIKTALALHNKLIPPSLHFTQANPKLEIENSPFYVNAKLAEWKASANHPRRAGVSSFGMGGTNAHMILEEAPELLPAGSSRPWHLLALSAKTDDALDRATTNAAALLNRLAENGVSPTNSAELADVCFTLQTGRSKFAHRRIVACCDPAEGAAVLEKRDAKRVFFQQAAANEPSVVFMFPGQGAQYAGMGHSLYRTEPVFRAEIDKCAEILQPILKCDLRKIMFAQDGDESAANELLTQTRFTQPALFVIEYALAKLWMSWGVRPAAMIGHSVGEYVAGCLADVFSVEEALKLVARRAALVQEQPGGAMLAVRLPEIEVKKLINGNVAIAAINSPNLCVVAGPHDAIEKLEKQCEVKEITARRLRTSHAFHSAMMDPVLAPFTELLRRVKLSEPQIPYISNVSARWITTSEATAPEYWAGHVRKTVRFSDGFSELLTNANNVFLEVGPGQTLATLARQHDRRQAGQLILSSLSLTGEDEPRGILESLGRLWAAGVSVDWQGFYANESRRRAVAPTYSFERKRYWPDAPKKICASVPAALPFAENASGMATAAVVSNSNERATHPPAPQVSAQPIVPRRERLVAAAATLLQELSGKDFAGVDPAINLLEFGLDSLLLTQAAQLFQRKFRVSITFRQLMEELNSLAAIASHLDSVLPPESFADAAPTASGTPIAAVSKGADGSSNAALEQLLQQQQQLTNQVLQLLGRDPIPVAPAPHKSPAAIAPVPVSEKTEQKTHGPFKPIDKAVGASLSPAQRAALDALIDRYTRRTRKSKELTVKNRPMLADPRSVSGFKQLWKEMVYPIYTVRSEGSKVWDADGNEYVDFLMGFGANLFGHRPPFVVKAVQEQVDTGFEIGSIQPLAGEVAELVKELTGMERVTFTNTGSEAVLAATRLARTVTGRDMIAVFAGSYHGIFDEVLSRPLTNNGEVRAVPIAPGIPGSAISQVIVLEYGNPQSLEIIRRRAHEIAAVLVEPVQSRNLDLQPKEFLQELRQITEELGTALVFDEVVTGFRLALGGAQTFFGIRADLATYGKVPGGGIPIGMVAGSAKFMDALDGGQWQYGDASFPEIGVTFFAGTFVRHPLALAAAKAVLSHLKESGPELQLRLNERTAHLANDLREIIQEFRAPYRVTQFHSFMYLTYPADQKLGGLIFYLLREHGIQVFENRAIILTTAHSDEDFEKLKSALRDSLRELVEGGFILPSSGAAGTKQEPSFAKTVSAGVSASVHADSSDRHSPFPLTEAQQEIWLAANMGGDAAVAYNEALKLEFLGPFDPQVFRAAVLEVVERHPILLARFSSDGQTQEISADAKLDIPLIDFSGPGTSNQEGKLAELLENEANEAFDLAAGPMLRVKIIRLSDDHHVVAWTVHHIVCDGWSVGVLFAELAKMYSAMKQEIPADLEQPASFRNYAVAEQSDAAVAENAPKYWREQFAQLPEPLDLPADRPHPLVRSAGASTENRTIAGDLHQALKRSAGQQRTTLVVMLMAAFETLLCRLTGQTDVVVGLGVAGQAMTGCNSLVGHCLNLLPIRTRLDAESSFLKNLASVKTSVLDAYDHHQCTIGGILQHIKVPRSLSRPPLVQVLFNFDRDTGAKDFAGLELKVSRAAKRALHFDLFLDVVETPGGLRLQCDYNTDLFDPSTIQRWLGHYEVLLNAIAANPETAIQKLPVLSEREQDNLIATWNSTAKEYDQLQTLHTRFEQQAQTTPDATALRFEGGALTYRELNRRANQLAHRLKVLGVAPDSLVGVFLERSIEMVVALFGILKAGGAYLPLDPEYPKDRLAFMLDDAEASVLLTNSSLVSQLPAHNATVLCLDTDGSQLENEPDSNPEHDATPKNLAYVIYTSGSTGRPKGVPNQHIGIVNRLLWMQGEYQLESSDRVLQKTPYSFDVSVWEFFWPLMVGAELVVAKPEGHKDPAYLVSLIQSQKITTMHFVPSMLRMFLETEGVEGCTSLKRVFCSGEALPVDLQERFFERLEGVELHNLYGPTEAAVDVTYWRCRPNSGLTTVPIGKPIWNTQIYILDKQLQPVPVGVAGELHIGGMGLARGYLNRPELTAEKFIADPFSAKPGARMYKTGDLARFLADGNIEYLGRIDHQVKIRGFRIELGEIESNLEKFPGIGQCVVMAREDQPGDKRLVAYFESPNDVGPSITDLRAHLKQDLPEYMIPSAFVPMKSLPLTTSGKIDRKALPAPSDGRADNRKDFASPADPVEQVLCHIWSNVLKVKRVGVHDNFFELGGHSLLAVRVIVEIEKIYKRRLPLATLLQAQTVRELAEIVRKENWTPTWSSLVSLRPAGAKPPFFLMHSHGGNVLEYRSLADMLGPDQPVFALQARGLDGNIPKNRTIESMASDYLAEIRSLQPEGPYYLGGFCFGGVVALEAALQLKAAGEEVALLAMLQSTHPASEGFHPNTSAVDRWRHLAAKRIDLERENMSFRGPAYIRERAQFVLDMATARTVIAYNRIFGNGHDKKNGGNRQTRFSTTFILESLAIEHDRAFKTYAPRPYSGDVVLFRASKQLPGLNSDPLLGWSGILTGKVDVCEVPGHQQNILIEPNLSRLVEELKPRLESAQRKHGDQLEECLVEVSRT